MSTLRKGQTASQPPSKNQTEQRVLLELLSSNQINSQDCIALKRNEGPGQFKQESVKSREMSTKKAPSFNKENIKPIDDGVLRAISGANVSRNWEEKAQIIDNQKSEIKSLRQCLNDIRTNQETRQLEGQRHRYEELLQLRQLEKQYTDNLREFEAMKEHLEDIRKKYQAATLDNRTIINKYQQVFAQNQELTQLIASLKHDLQTTTRTQSSWAVEEELAHLREDIRQLELQKQAAEVRAANLERENNDYLSRNNELQSGFSQSQNKNIKLLQEKDNLKVEKQELEQKAAELSCQLEAERQMRMEEVQRLRIKLRRQEQAREEMSLSWQENRTEQGPLLAQMRKQLSKLQQQHNNTKWRHESEIAEQKNRVSSLTEREQIRLRELREESAKSRMIDRKCEELLAENQRLTKHFQLALREKDAAIGDLKGELFERDRDIEERRRREKQIRQKIGRLEGQLEQGNDFLSQQNQTLHSENRSLTALISLHTEDSKGLALQLERNQCQKGQLLSSLEEVKQNNRQLRRQHEIFKENIQRQRQQEGGERDYYRNKYERELEQRNQLSVHLKTFQEDNGVLLKRNASNVVEIGNLKSQLVLLRRDIGKLTEEEKIDFKKQEAELNEARAELASLSNCLSCARSELGASNEEKNYLSQQLDSLHARNNTLRSQLEEAQGIVRRQRGVEGHLAEARRSSERTQAELHAHSKALAQKDSVIATIRNQLQKQVSDIRSMSAHLHQAEEKNRALEQQHSQQMAQFRQVQHHWETMVEANEHERRELEHSKVSASHELDCRQTTVEVLRRQNQEIQGILGAEIERRNATIRELVSEKKELFSRLVAQGMQ